MASMDAGLRRTLSLYDIDAGKGLLRSMIQYCWMGATTLTPEGIADYSKREDRRLSG